MFRQWPLQQFLSNAHCCPFGRQQKPFRHMEPAQHGTVALHAPLSTLPWQHTPSAQALAPRFTQSFPQLPQLEMSTYRSVHDPPQQAGVVPPLQQTLLGQTRAAGQQALLMQEPSLQQMLPHALSGGQHTPAIHALCGAQHVVSQATVPDDTHTPPHS